MLYNIYTKQWKNIRNILSINFIYHIILLIVYRRVICENFLQKKKYFSQIAFFFFFLSTLQLINQSRNQLNTI